METFQRKKLNDRVSFPQLLNMNHFLDAEKLTEIDPTNELIKDNPLLNVRPADFKAAIIAKERAEAQAAKTAKSSAQ